VSTSTRTVFGARGNRTLRTLGYAGAHREINFDPDDGLERTIGGEDLSRRFSYWNVAIAANYHAAFRPEFQPGVRHGPGAELRNYESVAACEPIRQTTNYLVGNARRHSGARAKPTSCSEYDYSIRDYQDRRSADVNGSLVSSNPRASIPVSQFCRRPMQHEFRAGAQIARGL